MIEISESQCSDETSVRRLMNRQWAYVMSETRLKGIATQVCQRRPGTDLYMANEKTHLHLRALGLSRLSVPNDLKKAINADIIRILSSGLFDVWMSRSIRQKNSFRTQCVKTEETLLKNKENAVFTLDSLSTFLVVVLSLLTSSILIVGVEGLVFQSTHNLKKRVIASILSLETSCFY